MLVAGSSVLTGALSACGSQPGVAHDTLRLPVYTRVLGLDPGVQDPSRFSATTPLFAAEMLNAGLLKLGPDLHVIPDLAVSIPTITGGARVYTFTIRQDARFSDGTRCTAEQVERSWARALENHARSPLVWQDLGGIEGAAAVSDGRTSRLSGVSVLHRLTIRIRLKVPDATFLEKLALPVAAVVKRSEGRLLGLGPWALAGPGRARGIYSLSPRKHYYGASLSLKSAQLLVVPDAARGLALYRKGLADAAWLAPGDYSSYQKVADFHDSDSLDGYYALPPRAEGADFASHLNRSAFQVGLPPEVSALTTLVPPTVPDYVSSAPTLDPPPGSPAPAFSLRLDSSRDPVERNLAHMLSKQWHISGLGSPVRVMHVSFMLPDPGRWFSLALGQTSSRWLRGQLAYAQTLTEDPVSRMALYGSLETWILERGFVVPLASGKTAYLVKPRVQGLQVTPLGIMPDNDNWALVSVS